MKLRPLLDSVVTRLLLLAFGLVIIGAVLRYYAITDFLKDDFGKVVESQQLALANYVAQDVEDKIVQRRGLLDRLAASLPVALLTQPDPLRAWLKERYEFQPLFSAGLLVLNAKGVAIAGYPVPATRATVDFSDRDYVRAALAGQPYVGQPVVGRATKEPVLPMSAPVRDARGQVIAVLSGVTALADPGFLSSLMQSHIGNTSGGFLLISPRDKLFVASSQPEMVLKPTPPPGVNLLQDKAMAGFRGTGISINAAGVEEISAMVSVPSTGWFVVARLPSQEAFTTVEHLKAFLTRGALASFVVFAMTATAGLYLMFRHLFVAAAHADRMTRGELPFEPLPIGRRDEIGHLIASFNRLLYKLNEKQEELTRLAHHDALTGLPNRALLFDRLGQVLAQARRKDDEVAVLFMDLDGFKGVNDTLGHQAGDAALRMVAGRLAATVREADTLARVGGDEFVLVPFSNGSSAEAAAIAVADKCLAAMQMPLRVAGHDCRVGVSIGIVLGRPSHSADEFLVRADVAMYEAKNAGRGRYIVAHL